MTEEPDFATVAQAVIDGNRFMTLATADGDGVPWASPVWKSVYMSALAEELSGAELERG